MRYIRIGIIVVFLAVTVVFAINWFQDKNSTDDTYPVIQTGSGILEVSVDSDESDLLKDVVASDEKDGDLTSSIVIESISNFVDSENHICNITYAVKDSDNHVTKKSRRIQYTDYISPRFTLSQPLCFNVGDEVDLADVIGAEDCLDGDISSSVKISINGATTASSGEYSITAQVTNSMGDTSKIKMILVVQNNNDLGPQIVLKKNIVYIDVGDSFDADKYVDKVTNASGKTLSGVSVEATSSNVDEDEAGCYIVQYMAIDDDGNEGYTYLTVVVEE